MRTGLPTSRAWRLTSTPTAMTAFVTFLTIVFIMHHVPSPSSWTEDITEIWFDLISFTFEIGRIHFKTTLLFCENIFGSVRSSRSHNVCPSVCPFCTKLSKALNLHLPLAGLSQLEMHRNHFLALKSSSRTWFLVSDSNAGLNCNVMSIRMICVCVCVPKTEYHTDGHYMSPYNPVSYKHVGFPLSMLITLMDITCLIIIPFHINMLNLTRGSHFEQP